MTDRLTQQMIRLYQPPQSKSLAEIGERFSISRQAVQQRLDRAGVPRRDSAGTSRLRYDEWATKKERAIERALRRTRDHRELARILDVPLAWVRRYLEARFGTAIIRVQHHPTSYSDDELLSALRSAAEHMNGDVLTAPLYDERRDETWPTSATLISRFGNWGKACRAAGVKHLRPHRVYEPTWTRDDVLDAVRLYLSVCKAHEEQPMALDYDGRWRKSAGGPSIGTIRKHFGSWREAVWSALR